MADRDDVQGKLCDIDHRRPAVVRVTVIENGQRRTLNVCREHYAELRARQASPFESLFSGFGGGFRDDLLGGFFDEGGAGEAPLDAGGMGEAPVGGARRARGDGGTSAPRRAGGRGRGAGPARESVDLTDYMSDQAEEILQQAARTAAEWGSREVDSEHLLFALADNDVVQAILARFKLSPEELKRQVQEISPRRDRKGKRPDAGIGVSPRVKAALLAAFNASRDLGHSYLGPEHLLIGLSAEEGLASDLLRRYGLTPEAIRQQTVGVVGKGAEEGRVEGKSDTPNLDKYSRDLSALAKQGKLDPVIGRAQEIETVIEILSRRKKNNPVLIGEPGVGKTAIVEGLAQRMLAGEVPEPLRGKRVVELIVTSLVAGTQYRGQFEERVKQLLEEISAQQDNLILFIDELHTIVGAGATGGEGGLDIANAFKPMLARGELHLIGATTLNEYQKHVEKDAALERRFQPVLVSEPTVEQTIIILQGLRDVLEAHHKVTILEEAIVAAAELSDRYIRGRYLPDKAIDIIDQAAARVRLRSTSRPVDLVEADAALQQVKRERDYARSRKNHDRTKELEKRLDERQKDYDQKVADWEKVRRCSTGEVNVSDVAEIISRLTGVPVTELTLDEPDRLIKMEERLHKSVDGQNEAVEAVSEAVRLARAGLKDRNRPIATFYFLGPTGVGKTELAKALAEVVFGDEDAMIRIDMSEYQERHTVARLIGAPPGYVGFEEGGQLTERVRRKPYSVLLLDEFEKAHPDVQNILLQVFDDGRLTDGKGRVIDFTNTIIISTSNVGSELIQRNLQAPQGERKDYDDLKEDLLILLRKYLRPEFLNRIDEVIVFHALDREQIRTIVGLQLERVKRMARAQGITLEFDQSLVDHLADVGYRPEYGARELRRQIRSLVETRLAEAMLKSELGEGDVVTFKYDSDTDRVTWEKRAGPAAERAAAALAGGDGGAGRGRDREPPRPAVH